MFPTAFHRILILTLFAVTASCTGQNTNVSNWEKQRGDLVENSIKGQGVYDREVLAAMQKVPRHQFVPVEYQSMSYWDRPLPIGDGQTISQPSLVAMMTELLELKRKDKVLEIGTGSGYQAAILGELVDSVFTIEIIETLGIRASNLLEHLGYTNIYLKIGDGYKGWPEHAPFDAIIVTCAPSAIPAPLQEQLAEGGRMIIPVGEENTVQELVLIRKKKGKLLEENIIPVRFVPMLREDGKTY
jgi:protein-L-isoaspartate(D-aspartate) O-methyltransferase